MITACDDISMLIQEINNMSWSIVYNHNPWYISTPMLLGYQHKLLIIEQEKTEEVQR
jgi:hypothetical protein